MAETYTQDMTVGRERVESQHSLEGGGGSETAEEKERSSSRDSELWLPSFLERVHADIPLFGNVGVEDLACERACEKESNRSQLCGSQERRKEEGADTLEAGTDRSTRTGNGRGSSLQRREYRLGSKKGCQSVMRE